MAKEKAIVSQEEMDKLKEMTGENTSSFPQVPVLKFNSSEGEWYKNEFGERDEENKLIYEKIGESIEFQILCQRLQVTTKFGETPNLYSREYVSGRVDLIDSESKEIVKSGMYAELKKDDENLVYNQVLYIHYEDKLWRMKLSGSKLTNWFAYQNAFKQNESKSQYITTASKGDAKENGGVKYFELKFKKGKEVDFKTVQEKVGEVNQYFLAIAEAIGNPSPALASAPQEAPPEITDQDVADIPLT